MRGARACRHGGNGTENTAENAKIRPAQRLRGRLRDRVSETASQRRAELFTLLRSGRGSRRHFLPAAEATARTRRPTRRRSGPARARRDRDRCRRPPASAAPPADETRRTPASRSGGSRPAACRPGSLIRRCAMQRGSSVDDSRPAARADVSSASGESAPAWPGRELALQHERHRRRHRTAQRLAGAREHLAEQDRRGLLAGLQAQQHARRVRRRIDRKRPPRNARRAISYGSDRTFSPNGRTATRSRRPRRR